MKKMLQGLLFGLGLLISIGSVWAYYSLPQLPAFTQTGRVNITASGTSSSVALASTMASTPVATTAVINNLGSYVAYVALGTSSAVAATVAGSYPVQPAGTIVLRLNNATYAAAITAGSSVSVSISTGY